MLGLFLLLPVFAVNVPQEPSRLRGRDIDQDKPYHLDVDQDKMVIPVTSPPIIEPATIVKREVPRKHMGEKQQSVVSDVKPDRFVTAELRKESAGHEDNEVEQTLKIFSESRTQQIRRLLKKNNPKIISQNWISIHKKKDESENQGPPHSHVMSRHLRHLIDSGKDSEKYPGEPEEATHTESEAKEEPTELSSDADGEDPEKLSAEVPQELSKRMPRSSAARVARTEADANREYRVSNTPIVQESEESEEQSIAPAEESVADAVDAKQKLEEHAANWDQRLSQDYDKEDQPYQALADVLAKFPLLAISPIWNLINPHELSSDPACLDTSFADLAPVLSPIGKEVARVFPKMKLRDLPVFEWIHPGKVEWRNAAAVALPDFQEFFPAETGRMWLQDMRLIDLKTVAERKRSLWATSWKVQQTTVAREGESAHVSELTHKLKQNTLHKTDAMADAELAVKELQSVERDHRDLQGKIKHDEVLVADQKEMLAAEGKLMEGLDSKVKALGEESTHNAEKLISTRASLQNMTVDVGMKRMMVGERDQAIAAEDTKMRSLKQRQADLEKMLAQKAEEREELVVAETEKEKLRTEVNATLEEETAESETNEALTSEVSTLASEAQKLTTST